MNEDIMALDHPTNAAEKAKRLERVIAARAHSIVCSKCGERRTSNGKVARKDAPPSTFPIPWQPPLLDLDMLCPKETAEDRAARLARNQIALAALAKRDPKTLGPIGRKQLGLPPKNARGRRNSGPTRDE